MQLEDYISGERLKIYADVLKLKPGEELGGYLCLLGCSIPNNQ